MKANELRIGNWVNNNDYERQITEISIATVGLLRDNSSSYDGVYIDNIQPIPLTEEWLLKFGFGKSEEHEMGMNDHPVWGFYYDYHFRRIRLEVGDRYTTDVIIPMEYVHQLQNLYFSLTGEELEIK